MAFAIILTRFIAVLIVVAVIKTLSKRSRRRRAQRRTRELLVSPLSGLVLGAMFAGFQAIVQPESRHRIAEEQKEDSLDDLASPEPPGGRFFHQQLRQIRQGREVEELVVRSDFQPGGKNDTNTLKAGS